MSKKPPKAKAKAKCPPGKHVFSKAETTDGWVIHLCSKCPEKIKRPRDKGSSGKAVVAAVILAVLVPLSAARCGTGQHAGLPVHTRNWWIQNLPPADYIVFGGQKPLGQWEQAGWVRRPPLSGQPRIRVWVQR